MNHNRSVTPMRPTAPLNARPSELQQQIRLRAFELFEQRGKKHGHDMDDWLRAEAEITRKRRTAVA